MPLQFALQKHGRGILILCCFFFHAPSLFFWLKDALTKVIRTQARTQKQAFRLPMRTSVVIRMEAMLRIRFRVVSQAMTSSVSQPAYSVFKAKAMEEKFMEATMALIRFMAGTCSEGPENKGCVNVRVESCREKKQKNVPNNSAYIYLYLYE